MVAPMAAPQLHDNIVSNLNAGGVSFDADAALVARLPDYFADYILFECPVSLDMGDIVREFTARNIFSRGPGDAPRIWREMFYQLKEIIDNDTRTFYKDYPFGSAKKWVRLPLDRRRRRV